MQIANPIYDVVFKYLMDDKLSARMLISAIIEEEVEEIEFLPQENTTEIELERRAITVYRLDFSAKIRTAEGTKSVIIEIQKAKYAADIMRFRKYLGEQYLKKMDEGPVPIVSIYFLGYSLEQAVAPVIKVSRTYLDLITHEELKVKEKFIESLTHDSYVIQIPYLNRQHRSELEKMLSIFDQERRAADSHLLNIEEDGYPELYRPLIKRLHRAVLEPVVRKTMDIEDEILEELEGLERKIEDQKVLIEEKDRALDEKNRALNEKDRALEESRREIEELKKRLADN